MLLLQYKMYKLTNWNSFKNRKPFKVFIQSQINIFLHLPSSLQPLVIRRYPSSAPHEMTVQKWNLKVCFSRSGLLINNYFHSPVHDSWHRTKHFPIYIFQPLNQKTWFLIYLNICSPKLSNGNTSDTFAFISAGYCFVS